MVFTGHVEHDDLLACYAAADLFVSMSEHEGFGVPLVEAMLMGVPVLARGAAAVAVHARRTRASRSTAATSPRSPRSARRSWSDAELRARVLAAQEQRLEAFAPAAVEADLRRFVESL